MGDDGEKFGAWPTTWEHCWGEGRWVDRFFEALEANADWLTTTTPTAWLAAHRPIGRVYVPTGSYAEMGEWALPPDESRVFAAVLHAAKAGGSARGALAARRVVAQLPGQVPRDQRPPQADAADLATRSTAMAGRPGPRARAIDHLYQGQSNDCYWHGLFGGIYIGHMRLATYEHLIAAEDLADTRRRHGSDAVERLDLDLDGARRGPAGDGRAGRHGRPDRGRRDRRLGHPGGPARADAPSCAAGRRPTTRRCASTDAAMVEAATDDVRPAGLDPRASWRSRRPGLAARLLYDPTSGGPGSSASWRRPRTAEAWATAEAVELGDAVDGAFDDRSSSVSAGCVATPGGDASARRPARPQSDVDARTIVARRRPRAPRRWR